MDNDLIISAVQTLASGDPAATVNHLRYGAENQRITLLQGSWSDITDMFDDAERFRKKYSLQHLVVAPFEPMTRHQMMTVALPLIAERLNFPACEAVVAEHEKDRSDLDAFPTHWHVVIEHFDPVTGKVRDWWKNRFKQELVARILEHRLSHRFIVGFYHDAVLDTLRREAVEHPDSDLGAVADALEAAHPRGSRPESSTVPKPLIRMHEAVGRDLVALRKLCNTAWRNTADFDQLNAALAPHGLYVQISENPPPKWMVKDADGVVGTVAGMMHAKNADVIGRLGDPNDDDWHRTDDAGAPAPEHGPHDHDHGEEPAGSAVADGNVQVIHPLAPFPTVGSGNEEAADVLESALNALSPAMLDKIADLSDRMAMHPLAAAFLYFERKMNDARRYLLRAAHDLPEVSTIVKWVRDRTAELQRVLKLARTPAERKVAKQDIEHHAKQAETYEAYHQKQIDEHRRTVVAKKVKHANRLIRVAERCRALTEDETGPSVLWIDPEALLEYAYEQDKAAKPGARWKVNGTPPTDDPDFTPTSPTVH